jgi:hypothetical protein
VGLQELVEEQIDLVGLQGLVGGQIDLVGLQELVGEQILRHNYLVGFLHVLKKYLI